MDYKIKYKEIVLSVMDGQGTVKGPETAIQLSKKLIEEYSEYDPSQEHIFLLGLDNKNDIGLFHLVVKGTYNATAVLPRDIFSHLLRLNLSNFVIVHNHPSGAITPSEEDNTFTKKLKDGAKLLGLNFIDHLIIANNNDKIYSFRSETKIL